MNFRRSLPLRSLAVFFHIDCASTLHFSVTGPPRNFNKKRRLNLSYLGYFILAAALRTRADICLKTIPLYWFTRNITMIIQWYLLTKDSIYDNHAFRA